jgi:uncharacterized protein YjiK
MTLKDLVVVSLVGATCLSCGRKEPVTAVVSPPVVPELTLLHVYSLSVTEPSGLAYCINQRTLYLISDNSAAVYKIDTTGRVLSSVHVDASDIEGIAVSQNADTLFLVEETPSLVSTFLANGTKLSSFSVTVRTLPNNALEGITVDQQGHVFVLNEKSPMMMLEYSGSTELSRQTLNYTTDISDICYDRETNCFWIVSDESKMLLKISRSGTLLGQWSTPLQQGEGVAFIGNRLYMVSDADAKLYVFTKPS